MTACGRASAAVVVRPLGDRRAAPAHVAPQLVPYNCAFLRLFYVFGLIERSFCMMCLVHCAVDASFKMVICIS